MKSTNAQIDIHEFEAHCYIMLSVFHLNDFVCTHVSTCIIKRIV